ncbi:NAD(P)-dependent alcohol dehydrogenase protein [Mycena sanguinolenta]|uniref:NAD(P)-dependent alcohol dehydrogenase protein n=1 Tax=Mycena sanguinolenta TaxID=230812 RepID=A0A8H7DMD4_9AGAR|nr:NAD(P)-dependent alcohol dehydrogenase protein [Mycena sanguinolenta]
MGLEFTVFKGSASGSIVEGKTQSNGPTGNEVLVKITHSGICGTDDHYRHTDMVLGHEGVGVVQEIGDRVSQFKIGDIVGWGFTHKTCGRCEQCERAQDQYCANRERYGHANFHQGSFGSHAIWDASFIFPVPPGLAPEDAAPLMCGGATVYNVIESYNIRPSDRVGVIGIGGLGHLAIQFLAKMGASPVVFSSTDSKRQEAMQLGATEFRATQGVERFEMAKLDHLIITTSSMPNWKLFLSVIKPTGTIFPLSADAELRIPFLPILTQGINIQGSLVASRSVHRRMLDFAARHKIKPIIERFPMTKNGVEEGMAKLRQGKMRYRGVLVA